MERGDTNESPILIIFLILGLVVMGVGGATFWAFERSRRAALEARQVAVVQRQRQAAQVNMQVQQQILQQRNQIDAARRFEAQGVSTCRLVVTVPQRERILQDEGSIVFTLLTDEDPEVIHGHDATFLVPQGTTARIEAYYHNLYAASDEIRASGETTRVSLGLRPGASVRGQVAPNVKATTLSVRVAGRVLEGDSKRNLRATRVQADGTFRLRGLPLTGAVEILDEYGNVLETIDGIGTVERDLGTIGAR